jgi:rubredoxin
MAEKECIEREAAYDAIKLEESGDSSDFNEGLIAAMNAIDSIPAADVHPVVRGKWIDRDDDYYGWNMWACSACGEEFVLTEGTPDMNDYHFCPNCGADMRETEDEKA